MLDKLKNPKVVLAISILSAVAGAVMASPYVVKDGALYSVLAFIVSTASGIAYQKKLP